MSQKSDILAHLSTGRTITPIEAINLFECYRLSGRIHELIRKDGHEIHTTMVKRGKKRFGRYTLIKRADERKKDAAK